jgi:hypothetical protein
MEEDHPQFHKNPILGCTKYDQLFLGLFIGKGVNFGRDNPYRLGVLIPGINKALLQPWP